MVKLGMGGRALYVLVRAVSVRPNMEPEVKEETAGKRTRQTVVVSQGRGQTGFNAPLSSINMSSYQAWWVVGLVGRHSC